MFPFRQCWILLSLPNHQNLLQTSTNNKDRKLNPDKPLHFEHSNCIKFLSIIFSWDSQNIILVCCIYHSEFNMLKALYHPTNIKHQFFYISSTVDELHQNQKAKPHDLKFIKCNESHKSSSLQKPLICIYLF